MPPHPTFYIGAGDRNAGPQTCVADTLLTEPSPQLWLFVPQTSGASGIGEHVPALVDAIRPRMPLQFLGFASMVRTQG